MTTWLRPVAGRALTWLPVFLIAAAFGPYLSKERGIRVENLAGALLGLWAGLAVLYRSRINAALFPVVGVSVILFLHIVVATLLAGAGMTDLKLGIGRLDHYSRPITVLLVCSVALSGLVPQQIEQVLVRCAGLLIALATANAVVQVLTLFIPMDWFVQPFRPDAGLLGKTVAELAAGGSRIVGIFNQPIEHGTVYAVALVMWVWLWRSGRLPLWIAAVTLVALGMGGAMATSKVFLLGGIPAALVLFFARPLTPRDIVLTSGVTVGMVFAFGAIVSVWKGGESILALIPMLLDRRLVLYALSGGRFGGEDYMVRDDLTASVLELTARSPLFGIGAGQSYKLQDNEYLMALGEGGAFALLLLILRVATMIRPGLHRHLSDLDAGTLMALIFVVALGSMGGPITGIPRSGTIVWVFIGLLLLVVSEPRSDSAVPRALK